MNGLIKVTTNNQGRKVVSSRELHKGLEIGRDFTNWIKGRINKYSFIENEDFIVIWNDAKSGDVVNFNGNINSMVKLGYSMDYVVTIDMAKELCMIENNDLGRKFRKYFIECENKLKEQIPQLSKKQELQLKLFSNNSMEVVNAHKELVKIEVDEATKPLIETIETNKPLVDFAETISSSADSIDIGTFAKLVKSEGVNLGRNKLFEWLRDNKYIMKNNVPYQTYIDRGYFEIVEYTYNTPYGVQLNTKTLVKGLGQIKILEKLKNEFKNKLLINKIKEEVK